MKVIETGLPGVRIVEPALHGDLRGWFMETWSEGDFERAGIRCRFVQDNHSFTQAKGTLRGLHFQLEPLAQAKLARVTAGAVLDVAADLRRGSPTYLRWVGVELSAENKRMLFIPRGFAHGFLTLTDNVEFLYKVDRPYSREHDRGIRWDDPAVGVGWGIDAPVLSDKDRALPFLSESDCNFVYADFVRSAEC